LVDIHYLEFDYTINCGDLTYIDQNHNPKQEDIESGTQLFHVVAEGTYNSSIFIT